MSPLSPVEMAPMPECPNCEETWRTLWLHLVREHSENDMKTIACCLKVQ
jgi:hypothetical protein